MIAGVLDISDGLVFAARLVLAAVFLMAAISKLPHRTTFTRDVLNYELLPPKLARTYAYLLPWLECAVALLLFMGIGVPWATAVALILLSSFVIAVLGAMRRGIALTCKCFGLLYRERVGWPTLRRDGFLAVLALAVLVLDGERFTLPAMFANLPTMGAVLALIATVTALSVSVGMGVAGAQEV
jgi:hypothetical protein